MKIPTIVEKPKENAKYSFFYDVWKSAKQAVTVAAPAAVGGLVLLGTCSGLDDITFPALGGISAAVIVNTLYRFIKNVVVEGKPLVK